MSTPDHGEEQCPNCGGHGVVPKDRDREHEVYRQCRNDNCRVRLYTPYKEFFQ